MTSLAVMSRILQRCRGGHPLAPEDAELVAYAIESRIRRMVRTLDEGFGLEANWPDSRNLAARDDALRELIASTPGNSDRGRAERILNELCRYAAGTFWHDADAIEKPSGRRGLLFAVLIANGGRVPCKTTIRNLFKKSGQERFGVGQFVT